MIQWQKVTWYSQSLAIVLGVIIFVLGLKIGSLSEGQHAPPDENQPVETFDVQANSKLTLETGTYGETRNFVFKDEGNKIITTFQVSNNGLEAPSYLIVDGPDHDWLVVRKLGIWGSSVLTYEDKWYFLVGSEMTEALTYTSYQDAMPPYPAGPATLLRTEVDSSSLPMSLIIEISTKTCQVIESGVSDECTIEKEADLYTWDSEKYKFQLTQ